MRKKKVELESLPLWIWAFSFYLVETAELQKLINYEASLAPKTEGGNVKGFSCYHGGNYNTLKDNQKEELAQKGKKVFQIIASKRF